MPAEVRRARLETAASPHAQTCQSPSLPPPLLRCAALRCNALCCLCQVANLLQELRARGEDEDDLVFAPPPYYGAGGYSRAREVRWTPLLVRVGPPGRFPPSLVTRVSPTLPLGLSLTHPHTHTPLDRSVAHQVINKIYAEIKDAEPVSLDDLRPREDEGGAEGEEEGEEEGGADGVDDD